MDSAQAFNAPEDLPFGGRVYPVRQLRLKEWAALQAWLKRAVPSPVTVALHAVQESRDMGVSLSQEVTDALFLAAQAEARKWPPAVGSRAWLRAVDSVEGGTARFVAEVLRAGGTTELSDDDAAKLVAIAPQHEFDDLVRLAYFGDPPAPKPPAPAATTTAIEPPTSPATTGE